MHLHYSLLEKEEGVRNSVTMNIIKICDTGSCSDIICAHSFCPRDSWYMGRQKIKASEQKVVSNQWTPFFFCSKPLFKAFAHSRLNRWPRTKFHIQIAILILVDLFHFLSFSITHFCSVSNSNFVLIFAFCCGGLLFALLLRLARLKKYFIPNIFKTSVLADRIMRVSRRASRQRSV